VLRTVLNILWFILGGWISTLLWLLAGVVLAITVVGLPYTPAAFRIAGFSAHPFGRMVVERSELGQHDLGTGPFGCGLNVIWFVVAGWWLALHHLAIALVQAVTIIGIPFAWQHVKLAIVSLAPVGREVIETA
jgi:uncharacterized membrane protein YccF (DUF307 family)